MLKLKLLKNSKELIIRDHKLSPSSNKIFELRSEESFNYNV